MVTAGKEGVEPVSVSDYGAYVTCAGVHRTDREDCGITRSRVDGLDGYAVFGCACAWTVRHYCPACIWTANR